MVLESVIEIGGIRVTAVSAGRVRMDGGAMFGVVPKPLWEHRIVPDGRNRIDLEMRCLIVETGDETILVETGFGGKVNARQREIYDLREEPGLAAELDQAGMRPEDVDRVMLTHLHQDHAGGATVRQGDGYVPAFPNARYVVQAGEWEDAIEADGQTVSAYRKAEVMEPLAQSGRLDLVEGETDLGNGVKLVPTPGHTRCHQSVLVADGDDTLFFTGDLVPTASHLKPIWGMAYDLYPRETYLNKVKWLARAAESGWWVAWPHDPELAWRRVRADERNGFSVVETKQEDEA